MRIIGGKFRGHKLVTFKADHIRPTSDRVKETIFNVLMGSFEGARVLDLFSGTGNLTAEAVSRGASHVDSVEMNRSSLKIMRENFQKLKIENHIQIHGLDVFKYLSGYKGEPYDIVLIDPPFTEKLADSVMEGVSRSSVFAAHTEIVIERSDFETLNNQYGTLFCYKEKPFGDKTVAFFRSQEE